MKLFVNEDEGKVNPCFVVVSERKTTDKFSLSLRCRKYLQENWIFVENGNKNPKTTIDQSMDINCILKMCFGVNTNDRRGENVC